MSSVFISHSNKDNSFAQRLAEDLMSLGHEPWLDKWEIKVGECIVSKIDRAIEDSKYVIIVLSSHSVKSGWVEKEWKTKYWGEIKAGKPLVLPVLVDECEIPNLLRTKKYADFRENYAVGIVDLVNAIDPDESSSRKRRSKKAVPDPPHEAELQKEKSLDMGCYWHPLVQEHFGQSLHIVLVRYASESIVFKESVLRNLQDANASNYMIFELFAEWDILIRLWATDDTVNNFLTHLKQNADIREIDHLTVTRHVHLSGDEKQLGRQDVSDEIRELGLAALRDIQSRREKSNHFSRAFETGLILRDNVAFDPSRIQFYCVLRSMRRPGEASIRDLLRQIKRSERIRGRTLYITDGTSIRMIIKGQAEHFYDISDFLYELTESLSHDKGTISTETMLVANRNIKVRNDIDFDEAEAKMLENSFSDFWKSVPNQPQRPYGERLAIMAKYCLALPIFHIDDEEVLINLLRAKVSGSPQYIKRIKDLFPHFEQTLRDNLPAVIRKHYGQKWQEKLDKIKSVEGIPESTKSGKLVLGDLVKVYKRAIQDHGILDLEGIGLKDFNLVMDDLPEFRNVFAHSAASLRDWDNLFDFCLRFVPIRQVFINYFSQFSNG